MEPNDTVAPADDSSVIATAISPLPVYVGFDLETTGVDPFNDLPVSFGFVKRVTDGTTVSVRTRRGYVNPGIAIPEGATEIHGITDDMVADAPPIFVAAETVAMLLAATWQEGGVIVGMNVSYDLTMVESLCTRLGIPTLSQRGGIGPVIDILVLDRRFDKWRKGGRKLTDLCAHYGVELDEAHDACADAHASLQILEVLQARFPGLREIAPSETNDTLRPWYQTWYTEFSDYREKQGNPPLSKGGCEWPIHAAD